MFRRDHRVSVTVKLLLFVCIIGLVIICVQTWFNIYTARSQNETAERDNLFALFNDYNDEVQVLERTSAALASSFADRTDLKRLFLNRDRAGLLALLTPIFETLRSNYGIVHLYIHEPNGYIFLRVHEPGRFGDTITLYRQANAVALRTRETVAGVELDPNRLGVRGIAPMFDDGEFIGMVEVGLDYDQAFIEDLKARNHADYTLWVTYEAAAPTGLWPKDAARESTSSRLFYYASTNPTPLPISEAVYLRVLESGMPEVQFVSAGGQELAVLVAPLTGYGERIIGILEISTARAEALAALRRNQLAAVSLASVLTLAALALMVISTHAVVLRSLRHLTVVAGRQLAGDLSARVEIFPNDEFGQLGRTFNRLTEQLGDSIRSLEQQVEAVRQAEAERERLLEQVREQARRVQQIVDTVPTGVLLLDTSGRVGLANPVARNDLAVLANAQVGDIITRLGDRSLAELLTSPPKGLWHEVKTDHHIFEVIARPIQNGPEPESWVLVISEVTREREIQRRVQQQERLAAVGQLAAGIAHDFNNIMAVIVLYAQMAARSEGLSARERERMQIINQQAQHATRLIQQILDFSRRAVLERRPLDLVPFLKEQVKLLEHTLPENIVISLNCGTEECPVNGDPTRLQQMLTNLALNARDAMPEGGALRIGLERVQVAKHQVDHPGSTQPPPEVGDGVWARLTVADTGVGIPPDVLPHIFEPFFTTKLPGKGSGLGLSQVHGIVAQHDGYMDVETAVGHGTTFTIYLPALPVCEPDSCAPVGEAGPLPTTNQGETLLVVEDNAETRRAMRESLEQLGYRVLEAANGQEALRLLEQPGVEVALILSDVVMPTMGGVALLHELRRRGLGVGMVFLTGHPLQDELETLRQQGMSDWLLKPVNLEQLADVIARTLNANSYGDG